MSTLQAQVVVRVSDTCVWKYVRYGALPVLPGWDTASGRISFSSTRGRGGIIVERPLSVEAECRIDGVMLAPARSGRAAQAPRPRLVRVCREYHTKAPRVLPSRYPLQYDQPHKKLTLQFSVIPPLSGTYGTYRCLRKLIHYHCLRHSRLCHCSDGTHTLAGRASETTLVA